MHYNIHFNHQIDYNVIKTVIFTIYKCQLNKLFDLNKPFNDSDDS